MSQQPPRRRGPIGGLFGLVGGAVSMGAEYKEHRKQQKQALNAQEEQEGPPAVSSASQQTRNPVDDAPPAYDDVAGTSDRSLGSGPPVSAGKNSKQDVKQEDLTDSDSDSSDTESIEDDEEDWELDEALQPTDSKGLPTYEEAEAMKEGETVDDLVREVMSSNPSKKPSNEKAAPRDPLPCPVIIPQRRPRKKERGFVPAYSPVLEDCGIGQDTFLKFLKNFHKSSQASPIFPAIAISARIAGAAPSVIAFAVCTSVEIAARVGAEVQSRNRTNNFLDLMNEELFKPAGTYAMIVKYKSDAETMASGRGGASLVQSQTVDVSTNQIIAKYNKSSSDESGQSSGGGMSDRMKNLRLASDTTKGSAQLPLSAPLVFPNIDYKLDHEGPETFKDKTKDAKKFLSDYMDRRAQMKYASQGPPSALNVPESQRGFKSSLADPNHGMHSGGLIALVSGGRLTPRANKRERRKQKRLDKDTRRIENGRAPRHERKRYKRYGDGYYDDLAAKTQLDRGGPSSEADNYLNAVSMRQIDGARSRGRNRSEQLQQRKAGRTSMVRRVLREDVLYLMIVNMPSEAELAEAREEMARGSG